MSRLSLGSPLVNLPQLEPPSEPLVTTGCADVSLPGGIPGLPPHMVGDFFRRSTDDHLCEDEALHLDSILQGEMCSDEFCPLVKAFTAD